MLVNENLADLGVDSSTVSWQKGTVEVSYNESKVKLEDIKKAITSEGYEVIK